MFKEDTRKRVVIALTDEKAAEDLLGTAFTQDHIDIIGRGQGVNKTTTAVYGVTAVEEFGVGDELIVHWQRPVLLDPSQDVYLHLALAPTTSEASKLLSMQINIAANSAGSDISDTGTAFLIEDVPVSDTQFISFETKLLIPKSIIYGESDDLHIRIKRVASSNDSVGDIALHHTSMEYQKFQK